MSFGMFRIKSLVSSQRLDWLFIIKKKTRSWICIMTSVKRILFEINKVICYFLYKDNERKRD